MYTVFVGLFSDVTAKLWN